MDFIEIDTRNNSSHQHATNDSKQNSTLFSKIKYFFIKTFLPNDYPNSVRSEYLQYQFWDSLQGASSYIRTVLTTKSLLQGAGVGSSIASPITASLIWIAKDGVGMIGSLFFAFLFSDTFEIYAKEWRYTADCLNNIALLLDLLSCSLSTNQPHYYFYFTILSVSTICKSCCGLIAGASKARISAHFAHDGYLADVTAKESTQEIAIALIGLTLGLMVGSYIESDARLTWFVFIMLLLLHQYANYQLTKTLVFDTFNPQRVYLLTEVLFKLTSTSHFKPQTSRTIKKFYFIDNSPRGQSSGINNYSSISFHNNTNGTGIINGRRSRSNSVSSITSSTTRASSSTVTESYSFMKRLGLTSGDNVHVSKIPQDPFSPSYISSLEGLFTPLWLHWYGPQLGVSLRSVLPFPTILIESSNMPASALQAVVDYRRELQLNISAVSGARTGRGQGTPSKRRKSAVKRSVHIATVDNEETVSTTTIDSKTEKKYLSMQQLETIAVLTSSVWRDQSFFICLDHYHHVSVCLSQECTDRNILQAYFLACYLHLKIQYRRSTSVVIHDIEKDVIERYTMLADEKLIRESLNWYDNYVEPFLDSDACQWDIREMKTRLVPYPWRYSSNHNHKKFD